jgi:hypothetical protein
MASPSPKNARRPRQTKSRLDVPHRAGEALTYSELSDGPSRNGVTPPAHGQAAQSGMKDSNQFN